jgi:transketolase
MAAPASADAAVISDRDAYRATLLRLAEADDRIWCLDSDMGGLETGFQAQFPGQYIDFGIAEANLVTAGAALAHSGLLPFVNTMAAFASARALEQVKIDVAYHNLPVRVIGTHCGLAAAYLGPTHHAQQDLAVMRAMPNMTVMTPADPGETARMIEAAAYLPGPAYIRIGSRPVGTVYQADHDFTIGKAIELRPGGDVTIIAAGTYPLLFALEAAGDLARRGVDAAVLNMHTIKPLDVDAVVRAARCSRGIITVEEHSVFGGLGGAVAEAVAEHAPALVSRVGLADMFSSRPGGHRAQLEACGVAPGHVVAAALRILAASA